MQVKCVLCDKVEQIEDRSLEAKRLRNRKINLYLCKKCYQRIGKKTNQRHATGNFHLYKEKKDSNDLI
ncbi:MAG TPA: YlaI family protein [Candidatus Dormibacteraeota bacterium]|nr:YlaI family protein [Candidatus Dormibacteraeota bacterium]